LSLPDELETTWNAVCRELRAEVTDFTFHIWLEPLALAGAAGDVLYVKAPGHIRTWVEERYLPLLGSAAAKALGEPALRAELVDEAWTGPPAAGGTAATPAVSAPGGEHFNPKYTFDQFVIGDGNRLAHAAALTVAEMPGQTYNPLFIYGAPGLGKTHLLHAIGNYVQAYGGGLKVCYATVEEFTSQFVRSLRTNEALAFRERFREADVLLIDDIQFLADKLKTKEEFFHTFNALYEGGSQLVLTSDRAPSDLEEFEARLKERFACGLVADLAAPDVDVRLAILRNRARLDSLHEVPDETLLEIARHVTSSVRGLEGALIRVVAYASLRGEPATPELASEVLERLYPQSQHGCTLGEIQDVTAEAFGVTRAALLAHDRKPQLSKARQVAMYLARELTDETLPAIGRGFGGRNHTTVLHAHRKIRSELGRDPGTVETVESLRRQLS
jgi:chromosomal replication initiator protein